MTVTFDFNFWTLLIFLLNFGLAWFSILSARSRASTDKLEQYHGEARAQLELFKEKTGLSFNRIGERLQAVETNQQNGITHEDLSAVHKRVDEMHKMMTEVVRGISRVEGLLDRRKGIGND